MVISYRHAWPGCRRIVAQYVGESSPRSDRRSAFWRVRLAADGLLERPCAYTRAVAHCPDCGRQVEVAPTHRQLEAIDG